MARDDSSVRPPFAVISSGCCALPSSLAASSSASGSAAGGEAGAMVGFAEKFVEKDEARISRGRVTYTGPCGSLFAIASARSITVSTCSAWRSS